MKAYWTIPSRCYFVLQTLFVLCCVTLLLAQPAAAQAERAGQADDQRVDANGRAAGDVVLRSAPAPVIQEVHTSELEAQQECDGDEGCYDEGITAKDVIIPRGLGDVVIPRDLGVIELLQSGMASFQVQKDAPKNSVHIDGTGNLGVGTDTPVGRIHVVATPGQEDPRDIFLLDENGNLELGGLLIEASSMLLKENFTPVETQQVLETLMTLPISTWNYKTDAASVRHMGPMAQDFYAAFGLGTDEAHLAPLDVNGVALSAVQALYETVQAQASRLTTLEQQNADLLQRLDALEALVRARDE